MDSTGNTRTATQSEAAGVGAGALSPQLTLILSSAAPMEPSLRVQLSSFDEVTIGRGKKRDVSIEETHGKRQLRLVLPDGMISTRHARLTCAAGEWSCQDLGSKNGTVLDGAKIQDATLTDGSLLEFGRTFLRFSLVAGEDATEIASDETLHPPVPALATFDPRLAASLASLGRIARGDVAVLVLGPTGSGKEVVARALHQLSRRRGELVAVNLAAISDSLLGAELFGCRRGAYSGADEDRIGLIRAAEGGTLFLDEFGDLSPAAQTSLLRVLQERVVTPLGTTKPVPVDVRLVAATHRNLDELMEAGHFREDLLARLNGFALRLPSLHERRDDIGLLIRQIVRALPNPVATIEFTQAAARALLRYHWPRNIRELASVLKAALTLVGDEAVDLKHLPDAVQRSLLASVVPTTSEKSKESDMTKERLEELLRKEGGNISAVAQALGKERAQVYRWIKRFAIDRSAFSEDPA